jgi:hypothetical protein
MTAHFQTQGSLKAAIGFTTIHAIFLAILYWIVAAPLLVLLLSR